MDIEIELPRDGEGTTFSKVEKGLRDANFIPTGRHIKNPMFYTRVYEVEYLDGHKASLAANIIVEIYFHKLMKRVIE